MNKELGNYIKETREELGISQREFARRINLDSGTMSRIENGLINKVSFDILLKLANEFKFDFKKLLKLSNYTDDEISNMLLLIHNEYDEWLLKLEDIDEDEYLEYTTIEDGARYIDITKVLWAFKNNKIDEKKAVLLITACKPIEYIDNKIIYPTENGDITIDVPW